jgi:integrase
MKNNRYEINRDKFLDDREQRILLKELNLSNRNELFILLALKTGARQSELLAITPNDINSQDGTVFIKGLKGSNDREMPVSRDLLDALIARTTGLQPDERIFPFCRQRLFQIWEWYRPNPNKGFHSLRHTFAINLYKRLKDIMLVKTALGHRSIKNTLIYANYVYSTEELRRIL